MLEKFGFSFFLALLGILLVLVAPDLWLISLLLFFFSLAYTCSVLCS